MSSYVPLPPDLADMLREEEAKKRERDVLISEAARRKAMRSAFASSGTVKRLEQLLAEADKEAGGDEAKRDALFIEKAKNISRGEDPQKMLARLQAFLKERQATGVFDFSQGGRLPPKSELAARMGGNVKPSGQQLVDEKIRSGDIRFGDHKAKQAVLSQGTKDDGLFSSRAGAPQKFGPTKDSGVNAVGGLAALFGLSTEIGQGAVLGAAEDIKAQGSGKLPGTQIAGVPVDLLTPLDYMTAGTLSSRGLDIGAAPRRLKAMGKGIKDAAGTGDPTAQYLKKYSNSLVERYEKEHGDVLSQAEAEYEAERQKAFAGGKREIPESPEERADNIRQRAVEKVLSAYPEEHGDLLLQYPNLTGFVTSSIMDLTNLAPGVRAGVKAVGETAAGQAVKRVGTAAKHAVGDITLTEGGEKLGAKFSSTYHADKLRGMPVGGDDAADLMSIVEPKAKYLVESELEQMEPLIKELEVLTPGEYDKRLVFAATHGIGLEDLDLSPMEVQELVKLDANYMDAVDINRELAARHKELRRQVGKGTRWDEEGSLYRAELENYGTPTSLADKTKVPEAEWKLRKEQAKLFKSKSDKPRTISPHEAVQDSVAQWSQELKNFRSSAIAAARVKESDAVLRKANLVIEVDNDPKKIVEAAGNLEKTTGLKWKPLQSSRVAGDESLQDIYQRVTGTPRQGAETMTDVTQRGTKTILVPEAMWDQLKPWLSDVANPPDKAGIAQAVADTFGLANRLAGMVQTVFRPAFHSTQFVSNVALAAVGGAIDPRIHAKGGVLAALNAGVEGLGDIPITLRSGAQANASEVVEAMRKSGLLRKKNILDMSAFVNESASTPAKIEKWLEQGMEKVKLPQGAIMAAKASDDYLKATVFLNHLDGLDDLSIARALRKARQFVPDPNTMGSFERSLIANTSSYYSWFKFGYSRLLPNLAKYPERFKPFLNANIAAEGATGENAPYTSAPADLKNRVGFTAPAYAQTPEQKQKMAEALATYRKNPNLFSGNSERFMAWSLDNPWALAIGFARQMAGDKDQEIERYMWPAMSLVINSIQAVIDKRMDFVAGGDEYENSALGRFTESYTKGQKNLYKGGYDLLFNPEKVAGDPKRQAQITNELGLLAYVLQWGRDLGIPLMPPGVRARLIDPELTADRAVTDEFTDQKEFEANVNKRREK